VDFPLPDTDLSSVPAQSHINALLSSLIAAELYVHNFRADLMAGKDIFLRTVLLVMTMLATATAANGARVLASVSGNDLYPNCTIEEPTCVAYITGVADTLEMVAPHLTNICRPPASTMSQVFDIVMAWLEDHPEERHRPAAKLSGLALAEAWPCRE
jgi:hypothetical protein